MKDLSLVLILSTVTALSSCTTASDDGGSCPESQATIVTGLGQSTLLSQSDAQQESGLVRFDTIQTLEPVQADRFMIAVVANAQFAASQISSLSYMFARIGNFFLSDANALSCIGPEFLSQQPIQDITITSDTAFSALYPAGSNLTSVFRVGKQIVTSPQSITPSDTIVARAPNNRETITEYLAALPPVPLLLAMTLDIDDSIASQHVFTVTYTLDNGNIFMTQTDPVSITP